MQVKDSPSCCESNTVQMQDCLPGDSVFMSLRSKNRQRFVRATSTVLAVTLVLLLTPCCEVFAALAVADVPVNTDVCPANHHDGGQAPPLGEHCAPWLEQAFIVPGGDAVLPSSGPSDVAAMPRHEQNSVPITRSASVVPHAGAPPPALALYLLTLRFLL